MNTKTAIKIATNCLARLRGQVLDLLTISQPVSLGVAVNLIKVVSKLSPALGNMIEFNLVDFLNQQEEFHGLGRWKRQDPGFPDVVFEGKITPAPGFEVKAWYPFATEITARFKDSQKHFLQDQTYVVFLAWLPEHLIHGKPAVQDLCIVSAASIAKARDDHYHNPPSYVVVEPRDTSERTRNLQQTNTNGYKWQGTPEEFKQAERLVKSWGPNGRAYSISPECQRHVQELISRYPSYRLDTNFAKSDRVVHPGIEEFKARVLASNVHGMTVQQWSRLLASDDDAQIEAALRNHISIPWDRKP